MVRPQGIRQSIRPGVLTCDAAISEGHGDAALLLLQNGADTNKKDMDGHVAIELVPDAKVRLTCSTRNDTLL